jgi:hypothetical protein
MMPAGVEAKLFTFHGWRRIQQIVGRSAVLGDEALADCGSTR